MYFVKYINLIILVIIPVIYSKNKLVSKQESLYASSVFRENQVLEGVKQLESFENISKVSHCLLKCMERKQDCKSFNYGNGECVLLSESICANETLFLTQKEGYSYYDVMETPDFEKKHLKNAYCKTYGKCSGRCYPRKPYYVNTPMTRAKARAECEKLGRELPQPQNLEENNFFADFIKNLLKEKPEIRDSREMQYWFGLSDEIMEGIWMYDDNTTVSQTFSAWAIGQPNNGGPFGNHKENCCAIGEKYNFRLFDVNCELKLKFFCA